MGIGAQQRVVLYISLAIWWHCVVGAPWVTIKRRSYKHVCAIVEGRDFKMHERHIHLRSFLLLCFHPDGCCYRTVGPSEVPASTISLVILIFVYLEKMGRVRKNKMICCCSVSSLTPFSSSVSPPKIFTGNQK